MILPKPSAYSEAIQSPQSAFSDASLKTCIVKKDPYGMPVSYGGGFTSTFKVLCSNKDYAIRCFTRDVADLKKRYFAIGNCLKNLNSHFFVNTEYIENGIHVQGQWCPIIKMDWINGTVLDDFIHDNYNNPKIMGKLASDFESLVSFMEQNNIAHGDLQHGNIMINSNQLFLIDYDGMFVPSLKGFDANGIGHPNYQHPQRQQKHCNDFSHTMDRFSTIVIYLSLLILEKESRFYVYNNSANIIFSKKDFEYPETSAIFTELNNLNDPTLSEYIKRFKGLCKLNYGEIPSLQTFKKGNFAYSEVVSKAINVQKRDIVIDTEYPIVDAEDINDVKNNYDKLVTVIGKVRWVTPHAKKKDTGEIFAAYFDFGKPKHNSGYNKTDKTFSTILYVSKLPDNVDTLLTLSKYKPYQNKFVRVDGTISFFAETNAFQIKLEYKSRIAIITEDEFKNTLRLKDELNKKIKFQQKQACSLNEIGRNHSPAKNSQIPRPSYPNRLQSPNNQKSPTSNSGVACSNNANNTYASNSWSAYRNKSTNINPNNSNFAPPKVGSINPSLGQNNIPRGLTSNTSKNSNSQKKQSITLNRHLKYLICIIIALVIIYNHLTMYAIALVLIFYAFRLK
jgi:hypothetical protein